MEVRTKETESYKRNDLTHKLKAFEMMKYTTKYKKKMTVLRENTVKLFSTKKSKIQKNPKYIGKG